MAGPKPQRGKYDRAQPAKERKQAQRDALLDAATVVFAKSGFARASVEAIVQKAGMSRRTFYAHFGDLRDVLRHVHDRAANLAFSLISQRLAEISHPLERIRTGIGLYLGAIATNPDAARVVFRVAAGPEHEPRHARESQRYADLLLASLREAHAKGLIPQPPDETIAYAVTTGIEGVALRCLAQKRPEAAVEAAPAMVALVFQAFGASLH